MAACDADRLAQLERLVRMLRAENEDLVAKGSTGATPRRQNSKQIARTPLRQLSSNANTADSNPHKPRSDNAFFRTPSIKRMETPSSPTTTEQRNPAVPGTLDRLQKRCQTLDTQLCDLDAENELLLDQVDALKSKVRKQETQIMDLEESKAAMKERITALTTENESLSIKLNDVLTGLMAAERWGASGAGSMCMCGLKDAQLTVLRAALLSSEATEREKSRELGASHIAHMVTREQLDLQRESRLRAEAEAEDARCALRLREIETMSLRRELTEAHARVIELTGMMALVEKRTMQLERDLLSLPGGAVLLNTV